MERKSLPVGHAALRARINVYARRTHVDVSRIQKLVSVAGVMKMLPTGIIVKEGNSLAVRFPFAQTRSSMDLDLAITDSRQQWQKEFEERLANGADGFIGRLTPRGKQIDADEMGADEKNTGESSRHHLPYSLPHFRMWPIDVHLQYNKRDFSKLPFDVTPDFDRLQTIAQPLSDDMQEMMDFIGLSLPDSVIFVNRLSQLRDKAASMYYTWPDRIRSHDLRDLVILDPDILVGRSLDPQVARMIIEDVVSRGASPTISAVAIQDIAVDYEAQQYGTADEAITVMKTIDASVRRELGRQEHR